MNVWVIAMDVIRIISVRGVVIERRSGERVRSSIVIRLMWMPGVRPVTTPAHIPTMRARINSNIIV